MQAYKPYKRILTEEETLQRKEWIKVNTAKMAKSRREHLKTLSPEQLAEMKSNKESDKRQREYDKQEKADNKQHTLNCKRELKILNFMKKNDVKYLHHGESDSMMNEIIKSIETVKTKNVHREYDQYIWNRQGEGNNYMPICQFGNIFSSREFESIYDIPLDGTYNFHIYDSGERGLGSFNRITAEKIEVQVKAPYVNPGALISVTVN